MTRRAPGRAWTATTSCSSRAAPARATATSPTAPWPPTARSPRTAWPSSPASRSASRRKAARPSSILPGFPTSAIFTFHAFVAPVLRRRLGLRERARATVHARLPRRTTSEGGRAEFTLVGLVRGRDGLVAFPLGKGSGSVTTFAQADGFFEVPADTEYVDAGEARRGDPARPRRRAGRPRRRRQPLHRSGPDRRTPRRGRPRGQDPERRLRRRPRRRPPRRLRRRPGAPLRPAPPAPTTSRARKREPAAPARLRPAAGPRLPPRRRGALRRGRHGGGRDRRRPARGGRPGAPARQPQPVLGHARARRAPAGRRRPPAGLAHRLPHARRRRVGRGRRARRLGRVPRAVGPRRGPRLAPARGRALRLPRARGTLGLRRA